MDKHPAACPYCGGTTVNQAWADLMLAHAHLNVDGTITVAEHESNADFRGPCLLHCHTCGSTYVQPRDVEESFDSGMKLDYPPTVSKDDERYIGADVVWVPLTEAQILTIAEALDTHEYWDFGEKLPRNNGHVWLPDDDEAEKYWPHPPTPEQAETIQEVEAVRDLRRFVMDEGNRQRRD